MQRGSLLWDIAMSEGCCRDNTGGKIHWRLLKSSPPAGHSREGTGAAPPTPPASSSLRCLHLEPGSGGCACGWGESRCVPGAGSLFLKMRGNVSDRRRGFVSRGDHQPLTKPVSRGVMGAQELKSPRPPSPINPGRGTGAPRDAPGRWLVPGCHHWVPTAVPRMTRGTPTGFYRVAVPDAGAARVDVAGVLPPGDHASPGCRGGDGASCLLPLLRPSPASARGSGSSKTPREVALGFGNAAGRG